MILVDSTVLVYALGADHELRAPCRRFVELVADASIQASTTIEVIQEFTHVRARPHGRLDAVLQARRYAIGLSPLARPEHEDLDEGLELFEHVELLGSFDAVLAATARRRGWALASADRAFATVPGLDALDPASPTFVQDVHTAG